ncbi:helix-turn-helix domain-containing protein [Aliagarivorans marinus]|uniref:helix-turn-helix domain-containing protein n=1 Tax=Aliagarivorans marinus TaxID=561965 RepID=UPI0003F9ABCD|nr:helix-turn-helix domain-containing protein [Aliagarivorans marinus]
MSVDRHIKSVRLLLGEPCKAKDSLSDNHQDFSDVHRHEYWEIIWCLDDQGSQSIDFVDYPNLPGRFFTIAPGQVHQSSPQGRNARLLVFVQGFVETNKRSTQLVESVFGIRNHRLPYLDCDQEGEQILTPFFRQIQAECQREECDWALVDSLLNCFMRYLLRFSKSSDLSGEQRDARVGLLLDLIDTHYKQQKKCDFYAASLSLTSKRINEIVKADMGKTVTQLIHRRIILEANRYLIFSDKSVKQIAFDLGFSDPAYFSRFYRKGMNESPAEFRLRCVDSAAL